jgi:hypothetical protein
MNRREAVKTATVLIGGVLVTSSGFLVACARDSNRSTGKVLSVDDQSLIEEIADTLLPTTPSSPGAKAASAGAAINLLLTDCYESDAQQRVVIGLNEFRSRVRIDAGMILHRCRRRTESRYCATSMLRRKKPDRHITSDWCVSCHCRRISRPRSE